MVQVESTVEGEGGRSGRRSNSIPAAVKRASNIKANLLGTTLSMPWACQQVSPTHQGTRRKLVKRLWRDIKPLPRELRN